MIEKIRVRNFQCHEDLEIEMDRVVSVIGHNDVGKSAIIRAIRWACSNVLVSSLIRRGAKTASVEVIFDGHKVKRTRDASDNVYELDGVEFRAFRMDVPDGIAKILNIDEVSFQGQHDSIYWFGATSGDVSRRLNAIVNLDIIDKTLLAITSTFGKAKAVCQTAEQRLSEVVGERDQLIWVDEAEDNLVNVEKSFREVGNIESTTTSVERAIDNAVTHCRGKNSLRRRSDDAVALLNVAKQIGGLSVKCASLNKTMNSALSADGRRTSPIPDIGAMANAVDRYEAAKKRETALRSVVESVRSKREQLEYLVDLSKEALKDLAEKTEGFCPICGREMRRSQK